MIPTVEDILIMLIQGECTHGQAMAWLEEHFKAAEEQAIEQYLERKASENI